MNDLYEIVFVPQDGRVIFRREGEIYTEKEYKSISESSLDRLEYIFEKCRISLSFNFRYPPAFIRANVCVYNSLFLQGRHAKRFVEEILSNKTTTYIEVS